MPKKTILILLATSLISLGCFSDDLNVKIRFDEINGLKPGEKVLFEESEIGQVRDVFYEKEGTYLVDVTINSDFKNAVTDHSRFCIVDDPVDPGGRAVEMIAVKDKGKPLEDGAVVRGDTRLAALIEKMEDDVSRAIGDLKQRFGRFSKDMKEVPENEDMKRLQKDLDQLLEEMKRSGAAFRDKVQKDIVPQLQKQIDNLKKRLQDLGREKEAEPLETRMDQIRRI